MILSQLMPTPNEDESGLRFMLEFRHGMPIVFIEELRANAAKDSANERFMYALKQSMILMLHPYKCFVGNSPKYYIDGPRALVTEFTRRAEKDI